MWEAAAPVRFSSSQVPVLCLLPQTSGCPDDSWERIEGACYRTQTEYLSWQEAKNACPKMHPDARLATPEFDLEQYKHTGIFAQGSKSFWIALRSTRDNEGRLRWSDDDRTLVQHTFWKNYLPRRTPSNKPDRDCVQYAGIYSWGTFTMGEAHDTVCDNDTGDYFLCELKLE